MFLAVNQNGSRTIFTEYPVPLPGGGVLDLSLNWLVTESEEEGVSLEGAGLSLQENVQAIYAILRDLERDFWSSDHIDMVKQQVEANIAVRCHRLGICSAKHKTPVFRLYIKR